MTELDVAKAISNALIRAEKFDSVQTRYINLRDQMQVLVGLLEAQGERNGNLRATKGRSRI